MTWIGLPVKATTFLVLGLLVSLAGCTDSASKAAQPQGGEPAGPVTMTIAGVVVDSGFVPIAGANVSVRLTKFTATTDALGQFRFENLARSAYLVDVQAAGFQNATLTAEPKEVASLEFILRLPDSMLPYNLTVVHRGFIECALEALIISPACDSLLTDDRVGGPRVFNSTTIFNHTVGSRWRTIVVDVEFDPSANPGLDGMRVTVRGRNDQDSLGSYQQYGRFYASKPFTFRLEPGQTYAEGTMVPENATVFRLETYPHGHNYHPAGAGVLGVGVGQNIRFSLHVTTFYNEPAPPNWSLFTSGPA
jgi:hypothetical protein